MLNSSISTARVEKGIQHTYMLFETDHLLFDESIQSIMRSIDAFNYLYSACCQYKHLLRGAVS